MPGFHRLPQLRITVNSHCGRRCFFCRPSGEGLSASGHSQLSKRDVIQVCGVAGEMGVTEVKLTGGDPALWEPLVDTVYEIKRDGLVKHLEVLSRHPRIGQLAPALAEARVDLINVSLDTLQADLHRRITGVDDLPETLNALTECVSSGIPCKVNTIVMRELNDKEIASIITYCEHVGVRYLKLNDVIRDLHNPPLTHASHLLEVEGRVLSELYCPMGEIQEQLRARATKVRTKRQGGLGHPMLVYSMPSGLDIIVKDHCAGAWYSSICKNCAQYPCHDALMALRLTADAHLQFCLLRRDTAIDIRACLDSRDQSLKNAIRSALEIYNEAEFRAGSNEIESIVG